MNRFVRLVAAVFAANALVSSAETWTDNETGLTWEYRVVDGDAYVGNSSRAAISPSVTGDVTIPTTFLGVPVRGVSNHAFADCREIVRVIIPEGVTSIGAEAFLNCTALAGIELPKSVDNIDPSAFVGCDGLAVRMAVSNANTYVPNYSFGDAVFGYDGEEFGLDVVAAKQTSLVFSGDL